MTEDDLAGSVIPVTRGPIRERADGTMTCTIVIQPQDALPFMKLFPEIDLPGFIVRQAPRHAQQMQRDRASASGKPGKGGGAFGQYARALRLHIDWMGNPEVWAVVGSDTQYLEWCRDQPCANRACKFEPRWENDRWVRCEAAHVRRISNGAGESIKPLYSAIPLCHQCHALQHQKGESAIGGKEWADKARIDHVQDWVWARLRSIFDVESMAEVAPGVLLAWAQENSLDKFLPRCYVTEQM